MDRDSGRSPHQPGKPPGEPSNHDDSRADLTETSRLSEVSGLDRIRALSHLLDDAIPIPGTNYAFGIDPLIGLLPAGGDIMGSLLSAYIVLEATRFRLSAPTLTRMVFNIVLEMIVGTIPLIGDVFDVGWKANVKNLRLIESHLQNPQTNRAADRRFFIILVIAFIVIIAVQIAWYVVVFRWIIRLLSS